MKRVIGFKIIRRKGIWPMIARFILPGKVPIQGVTRTGHVEYYEAKIGQYYKLKFRNVMFVYSFSGTYLRMLRYRG
jgi:hypothetical protein